VHGEVDTIGGDHVGCAGRIREAMTTPGPNVEMVTIPRAELDALKAEVRRLRLAEGDRIALARMKAHPTPDPTARRFSTAEELAEAMGLRG
jgi:hypothetical protein